MFARKFWVCVLASTLGLAGCGQSETPTADSAAPTAEAAAPASNDSLAAEQAAEPQRPRVAIETKYGKLIVELDPEKAPLTVQNFLDYVDSGHYDGTIFHQVVEGYIALGGGYTPDNTEKPVHSPIRNEAHNGLKNERGTIAMARSPDMIDSSTCQFFINLKDNPALDYKDRTVEGYGYCVFGKVISGMEVLKKIEDVPVDQQEFKPTEIVLIETIRRL